MAHLVGTLETKRLVIREDNYNYNLWVRRDLERVGRHALNCHIVLTLHRRQHDD